MTADDEGKEKAIRYYRILAVVLGILGAALLALGVVAVVKQSNYEGEDTFGLPYFVGGFIVGVMNLVSAAICTCVLVKGSDENIDVRKKEELACAIVGQYIFSMFMFMGCFVGTVMAGVGGFIDSSRYQDIDDYYYTKQKLAIAIIVLCVISLVVTICSFCVVCTYGSYFGVVVNKRRGRMVISGTGATGGMVHPARSANNDQIRQLEVQNRLLQQQLELQRQLNSEQKQNQYSGGLYPPPPPANYNVDFGPSAPPPSYDSLK